MSFSSGKPLKLPLTILGMLIIGGLLAFLSMHREAPPPEAPAKTSKASTPGKAAAAEAKAPTDARPETLVEKPAMNYYDQLPPLEEVIKDVQPLSSKEIDAKIKDVEQEIVEQQLVQRANDKTLDEAGYRELARLLQWSDALYNVKIERQLSALEGELGLQKKGA